MRRSSIVTIVTMVTLITIALLVVLVVMPPGESAAKDELLRSDLPQTDTNAPDSGSTGATVDEEGEDAGADTEADPFETSGANVMLEILDDFERFWVGATPVEERRLDGLATALGLATESESDDPVAVVVGRGAEVVLRIADAMIARATREAKGEEQIEVERKVEREATNAGTRVLDAEVVDGIVDASRARELVESFKESLSRLSSEEIAERREQNQRQLEILSKAKARLARRSGGDASRRTIARESIQAIEGMLTLNELLTRSPAAGELTAEEVASRVEKLAPLLEGLVSGSVPTEVMLVEPVPEALGALLAQNSPAKAVGGATQKAAARPTEADLRIARALRNVRHSVKELEERLARLEGELGELPATPPTTEKDR